MDPFKDREAAAEALYIREIEAAATRRLKRLEALAEWVGALMKTSPGSAASYADMLCRIAPSPSDDQRILERVCNDLADAGVPIPSHRVAEKLGMPSAE